jgi:hypothetical protein
MELRGPSDPPYRWSPRAIKASRDKPTTWWKERPWQFYGLTQASQQLRAEYRPLWMRALEVRLTLEILPEFEKIFLPQSSKQLHAPKMIQISWEHGVDNHGVSDQMTSLLKLRARFPTLRYEFVPYGVADEKAMPGDEPCDHCSEMISTGRGEYYEPWNDIDCECIDPETPYQEWIELEQGRMAYTQILGAFLHNDNEPWAKAILNGEVTAKWMYIHSFVASFRISCKEPFCLGVTNMQDAWDVLKGWGILDLPRRAQMDIILAYTEVDTTVIDGYEVKNSFVCEFKVPRARLPEKAA